MSYDDLDREGLEELARQRMKEYNAAVGERDSLIKEENELTIE